MDPVEKLSPRWPEEYLNLLRYTLDLNEIGEHTSELQSQR